MIVLIPIALVGALVAYDMLHDTPPPPEKVKPTVVDFHHKMGSISGYALTLESEPPTPKTFAKPLLSNDATEVSSSESHELASSLPTPEYIDVEKQSKKVNSPHSIRIDFNKRSRTLTGEQKQLIKDFLAQYQALSFSILVKGFSSPDGDEEFNRTLAKKRAELTVDFLKQEVERNIEVEAPPDEELFGGRYVYIELLMEK